MGTERPTEADARRAISSYLHSDDFTLRRYTTGLCHYVYEVTPRYGPTVVLRMAHEETKPHLTGSLYWTERLLPLGIPLPRILLAELGGPFPYTILEYIPGVDLGQLYPHLRSNVRQLIAEEVSRLQILVQTLPPARGYGFAYTYEDGRLKSSWREFLLEHIGRSRHWIETNGICKTVYVERVQQRMHALFDYIDQVQPTPFLHDTTTKNVLISDSGLLGIVDVDDLCFGDPLFVLALTNMAVLSCGWDVDYINYWAKSWNLSPRQYEALRFYTAVFCVGFMGEIGQKFNKDVATVDHKRVAQLEKVLESLMS